MIIGIGVDICDISRFVKVLGRASPLFYKRLLSPTESQYFQSMQSEEAKAKWLAGVFAAKEAVLKANGTGLDGRYSLHTISTFDPSVHCWRVRLPASIHDRFGEEVRCHLSVSFSKQMAAAFAVLEK